MAVPKKKVSVSRKRTRLNSIQHKMKNYTQCNKCLNFIPLHRRCSSRETCELDAMSTNIINKYNTNFL